MIRPGKKRTEKKHRFTLFASLMVLLTTAGAFMFLPPLSLRDIGSYFQSVVGKSDTAPTEAIISSTVSRGSVYDRNFKELSVSYSLFGLYVHPAEIKDNDRTAQQISRLLNKDKESLLEAFKLPQHTILIAENLEGQQAEQIESLGLKGVYCRKADMRFYPEHITASHLVGYTENNTGLAGVEGLYDTVLQPGVFNGSNLPQIDLDSREILGKTVTDIILSLDLAVQKKIETELGLLQKDRSIVRAVGLVIDPRNGELLSSASLPSYNPNYFWKYDDRQRQDNTGFQFLDPSLITPVLFRVAAFLENESISATLPPVTVAAADYGLSPEDLKICSATEALYHQTDSEHPSGMTDGLTGNTPLTSETGPLHSPLQILATMAGLINGGWKISPYVLNSIFDHASDSFFYRSQSMGTKESSRNMNPAMGVKIRRDLAESYAEDNSDDVVYSAQIMKVSDTDDFSGYLLQELLLAWSPKKIPNRLLLLAIQHADLYPLPQQKEAESYSLEKAGSGIMQFLADRKPADTDPQYPREKDPYNYKQFLISRKINQYKPLNPASPPPSSMPDITGLSLRKALQRLNDLHLKIQVKGHGKIVTQEPAAGQQLHDINSITLTLDQEH